MEKFEQLTLWEDLETGCGIKECAQEVTVYGNVIATASDEKGHEIMCFEEHTNLGNRLRIYIPYHGRFFYIASNVKELQRLAGNAFLSLVVKLAALGISTETTKPEDCYCAVSVPAEFTE